MHALRSARSGPLRTGLKEVEEAGGQCAVRGSQLECIYYISVSISIHIQETAPYAELELILLL